MKHRPLSTVDIQQKIQRNDKKKITIIILIIFLFFLSGILTFVVLNPNQNPTQPLKTTEENVEKSNDTVISTKNRITLPGWGPQEITKTSPYLYMHNPDNNDVYFVYNIILHGVSIHKTAALKPAQQVRVNLYEILDAGEYQVRLNITTYSMDTQTPLNGGNVFIKVIVKK